MSARPSQIILGNETLLSKWHYGQLEKSKIKMHMSSIFYNIGYIMRSRGRYRIYTTEGQKLEESVNGMLTVPSGATDLYYDSLATGGGHEIHSL